jgi:hypothetical protein
MKLLLVTVCCSAILASGAMSAQAENGTPRVPKVAMLWTFAENERGTSEAGIRTANDLLRKLFEQKAGYEVVSEAISRSAWSKAGLPEKPSAVEELGQLPNLPDANRLLEFGQKAGVDFVCVGNLGWRVKSLWVGLGPKTKCEAIVNVVIIDVNKKEVALDARDVSSDSTKAEKWYESAGALLLTWGITLFSGGPKTPHIQRAAVKGIGFAADPFFNANGRRIMQ